tara:strand:+ start:383 stop:757 length:375 start_codon:yes stop_codon:yes gene_type:complete
MYSYITDISKENIEKHIIKKKEKNYQNTAKILDINNENKQIKLEISYSKNNSIFIKNLHIDRSNFNIVISRLIKNNFIIENIESPISKNCYSENLNDHPEANKNTKINNMGRIAYTNSFYQKYT